MAHDESGTSFNPTEEFFLVFKEVQKAALTINSRQCQCLLYRWKQVDGYFFIWTSVFNSEVNEVSLVLKEIIRLLNRTLDLFKHWNRKLHCLRQVNDQEFQVIYKDLNRYIDIVQDWILKNVSKGQSTSLSERIKERILSDNNFIESYHRESFHHDRSELEQSTRGVPQQDQSFILSQHVLRILNREKSEIPIIEHENLQFDKQIGKGAYGKVYAGTWLGEDIAIKEYEKDDLSCEPEVEAFKEILDCDPHVLQAIGCSERRGSKLLVIELMKMDLQRLLKQHKILPFFVSLSIILQVVRAMKYLHDKNLMHRDLKPKNILVSFSRESVDDIIDTDHISVKMTDFGTAKRTLCSNPSDMTSNRGTTNYMAPEVLGISYNKKADVYSFGITCCEILRGSVHRDAPPNLSPRTLSFPEGIPEELENLIRQCCNDNQELRPNFDFIEEKLQHIQQTELLKPASSSCVVSTESSGTGKVENSIPIVMQDGRPNVFGNPFVGDKLRVEASVRALYKWIRIDGGTEIEILHLAEPSNTKVLDYHLTADDVDKTIALEYLIPENPVWIRVYEKKICVGKKMQQGIDHYYKQEVAIFSIKERGKGVFPFWQKRKGTLIINKTDYLLFWDKGSPLNKRIILNKSMVTNPPIKILKSDLRTCTISGNGTSWEVQFCKDEDRDLAILTMNRFLENYKVK